MAEKTSEKEKKPVYKKWWFWVIIIVVVATIAGAGSGSNDSSDTSVSNSGTATVSDAAENTTYKMGDNITKDGLTVRVDSLVRNYTEEYRTPDEGKELVMVTVSYENNSSDKESYNLYDWKMESSDGDIKSPTYASTGNDLDSGELSSGGKKSGNVVFEVPKDDQGLKLHYSGNIFSSKDIVIEMHN